MKGPRGNAFSLIECLLVIGIITLMAAILFPVFNLARENARRASCQSNLRQLGLGLLQYVQDNDERYPRSGCQSYASAGACANSNAIVYYGWVGVVLAPYIKDENVWRCPSRQQGSPVLSGSRRISYQYNYFSLYGLPSSASCNPAQGLAMWDSDFTGPFMRSGNATLSDYETNQGGAWRFQDWAAFQGQTGKTSWHLSTSNFLFLDGHVKATSWDRICWANLYAAMPPSEVSTWANVGVSTIYTGLAARQNPQFVVAKG